MLAHTGHPADSGALGYSESSSAPASSASTCSRCTFTRRSIVPRISRAASTPLAACVSCWRIRRPSSSAPSRALDLGAQRATRPARRRRRAPSARGRGRAGRRPGAPSAALLGVVDHEQLVAVDLAQRLHARRQLLLGGHDPDAERRRRAGPSPRRARRARPSWPRASSWPRTRSARAAEPEQPSIATSTSPLRPPTPGRSPTASQSSPGRRRSRRSRRTPPPRTGGPWRSSGRARRRPRAPSPSRPAASRSRAAARRSAGSSRAGGRAAGRTTGGSPPPRGFWNAASGLDSSAEENWLEQPLARLVEQLGRPRC